MRYAWRLLISTVLAATVPSHVRAAAPQTTPVLVECKPSQLVAGLPLRVIAAKPIPAEALPDVVVHGPILPGGVVPLARPPRFDASGQARVELPVGFYIFEALAAGEDGTALAIRSATVSVPRTEPVPISAGDPQPLTLRHQDHEVEITEVALRSAAAIGEIRWRRTAKGQVPKIVLTPGKSTGINVIGNADPIYVAAWRQVSADEPVQVSTDKQWNMCQFRQRDATPAARRVTAVLVFPDSRMEIPLTDAARLVTNRRFLMMGYRLELPGGECLEFDAGPYVVRHLHRFELGGAELTPRAWAAIVPEIRKGQRTPHLVWRYDLLDPGGHRLNVRAGNCGVTGTAARADGKPLPDGPLDEEQQKSIGDPTRSVRVGIQWTWNGPQSRELSPEGFVPLRSEHFRLEAIPAWIWRSQNYLSIFERLYLHERAVTGRPGPSSVAIHWRKNAGSAAAGIGRAKGGQHLGCSMPFPAYERCNDPFVAPWASAHELMHTFGYNHGEEMRSAVDPSGSLFTRYRWHIVDHPEAVPLIAAVVPAEAVEKPKAVKKSGPKKNRKKG